MIKKKKFFLVKKKKRKSKVSDSDCGSGSGSNMSSQLKSQSQPQSQTIDLANSEPITTPNICVSDGSDISCVDFMNSLTDVEREVFEIAKDHLKSSFHIKRSNGYEEYCK